MNSSKTASVTTFFVILCVLLIVATIPSNAVAQEQTVQRINIIELNESGDAQWSVEVREPLETETDVSNFESYVEQVNNTENNQTTNRFRDEFERVVQGADDSYERDMSLGQINVDAKISNTATGTFGLTIIQFKWVGYADSAENGNIKLGQILSDGYTIDESERLRIVPPEGYATGTTPAGSEVTDDNDVQWTGPYAFTDLSFNFTKQANNPDQSLSPAVIGSVALIITILSLIGAYKYRSKDEEDENEWSSEDLETEEEKVVSLLEENDGRIKQKSVSDEFDWSDTKVSRVTGELEEENIIRKLTVGRENVLDLNEGQRSDDT